MGSKVFFVILGLLILCCVLSVGVGVFRDFGDDGSSEIPPAWMEGPGSALEQRLKVGDVSAAIPSDCRTALQVGVFELSPGDVCTLIVEASSSPLQLVRTLSLGLTGGQSAVVLLDPHAQDRLTAEQTLEGGDREMEVQVFKEGGTLEIQCLSIGTDDCRIEVLE